jgi:hypothetical protein
MPIVGSFAGASARAYGLGAGGVGIGDFYQIATNTVGSGGASSIVFSSIPQIYTHLQLRISARATSGDSFQLQGLFNSDSGGNYSSHFIYGDGTGVGAAAGNGSLTYASVGNCPGSNSSANIFGCTVTEILDYTNTNKFKTTRCISGADRNGTLGYVFFPSANWRSTNAITSITLNVEGGSTFAQNSVASLYGIVG